MELIFLLLLIFVFVLTLYLFHPEDKYNLFNLHYFLKKAAGQEDKIQKKIEKKSRALKDDRTDSRKS